MKRPLLLDLCSKAGGATYVPPAHPFSPEDEDAFEEEYFVESASK